MSKWVIVKLSVGSVSMLNKAGTQFTDDVKEAMVFENETDAILFSATIKTPTLVHQLADDEAQDNEYNFPVPDFFEAQDATMDLTELVWFIRQDELIQHFTPVDKITGANQMTGDGISHPFTGRLIGREYQFSFARLLNDDDSMKLHDVVLKAGWDSATYVRKRNGFTAYGVLTLRAKNK